MVKFLIGIMCLLAMPFVGMAQDSVRQAKPVNPRVAMALSLTFGQQAANHKVCSCTDPTNCTCGAGCNCANCLKNKTAGTQAVPDLPEKGGDPLILASDGRYYPLSAWGSSGLSGLVFEPMRTAQPVIRQSGYVQPSLPVRAVNVSNFCGFSFGGYSGGS